MTRDEVRAAVMPRLSLLLQKDEAELPDGIRLRDDLKANSQTLWAASAVLERVSGKEISFLDLSACETLGDALDLAAD